MFFFCRFFGDAWLSTNTDIGFFPLWMAVLCFFYMIIALRTNVCFVVIFFLLTLGLSFDTAAHWRLALDYASNGDVARRLTTVSLSV